MRRPRFKRLAKRGDVDGLIEGLRYRDYKLDGAGGLVDLAVGNRLLLVDAANGLPEGDRGAVLGAACADPDPRVRGRAVAALVDAPDPMAGEALAVAVAGWPSDDVAGRAVAVAALGRTHAPDLGVTLASSVVKHPGVPADDGELLRHLLDRAQDPAEERRCVELLIAALGDDALDVRTRAATVLEWLGGRPVEQLLEALDAAGPRDAELVRALGRTHDRRAADPLVRLLQDDSASVRREAAAALRLLADPRTLDALLAAADDDDHEVRIMAMSAVDRMGSVASIMGVSGTVRQQMEALIDEVLARLPAPAARLEAGGPPAQQEASAARGLRARLGRGRPAG